MNPQIRTHNYQTHLRWIGNLGAGTSHYRDYSRDYEVSAEGKQALLGSSDPAFRGDPTRYNPEELLVASLSACHMLWYLHLCAVAGVVVTDYADAAEGTMEETADGSGRFSGVTLRPTVTVTAASDVGKAGELHKEAHRMCFIANSVDFDVACEPTIITE